MANGQIPFVRKGAEIAEIAAIASRLPYAGFVEGSDRGETRAQPKIWAEMYKFRGAAAKMQEEMTKLNIAAKSGSLDASKGAADKTGKSCKACHDVY